MEDDRKITIAEGVEDRTALRESIARKLSRPVVYRSIDIDVAAEEKQKAQAAMDQLQMANAAKSGQKPSRDLSKVAENLAARLSADGSPASQSVEIQEPAKEGKVTKAYKSILKALGFKLD